MNIKTQKIICFIPYVNCIVITIFWFRMIILNKMSSTYVFKPMLKIFALIMAITVLRLVTYALINIQWIEEIVSFIANYLSSLVIAFVLLKEQEKHPISEDKKNNQ